MSLGLPGPSFQQLGAGSSNSDWEAACATFTKGGIRQKVAKRQAQADAAEAQRGRGPFTSFLANYLLEQWGFGLMSAKQVQSIAFAALRDGLQHPDVLALAKAGTFGKYAWNCHRDVTLFVETVFSAPLVEPMMKPVPFNISKGEDKGQHEIPHAFLNPHEWLAMLYNHYPKQFAIRLLGKSTIEDGQRNIQAFWANSHTNDPRKQSCHQMQSPTLVSHGIPAAIYGDGVPCTNSKSLHSVLWESLLGQGLALDTLFFATGYFNTAEVKGMGPESTQNKLWKHLVWSFRACAMGTWPLLDSDGNEWPEGAKEHHLKGSPLAGGFFIVWWLLKGDMDWNINFYHIPGHWASHYPCPFCPADDSTSCTSWANFNDDAVWKGLSWATHDQWLEHCRKLQKPIHILFVPFEVGGLGLSIFMLMADSLHTVELGVAKHILGNVLYYMVMTDMMGSGFDSPEKRLAIVWSELQSVYKEHQVENQLDNLDLGMFMNLKAKTTEYPRLSSMVKAAETRHLAPCLFQVWRQFARLDKGKPTFNQHEQCIDLVLKSLVRYYSIIDTSSGPYLSHEESDGLIVAVNNLISMYRCLQAQAVEKKMMMWHVVPKFHHLWHHGQQSRLQSPKASRTYGNEDVMGKLAILGASQSHGAAAARRSKGICKKYALGMLIRLQINLLNGED